MAHGPFETRETTLQRFSNFQFIQSRNKNLFYSLTKTGLTGETQGKAKSEKKTTQI